MKRLFNTIKYYLNELSFFAVFAAIYLTFIGVAMIFDPTAKAFDAGVFQHLFYGASGYILFKMIAHLDIRLSDKSLFKYLNSESIQKDLAECTPYQRRLLYFLRLGIALICMAILAALP